MSKRTVFRAGTIVAAVLASIGVILVFSPIPGTPVKSAKGLKQEDRSTDLLVLDPENPCGPVSVALVSHILEPPLELAQSRELVHCDPLGRSSMLELVRAIEQINLSALGLKLTPESLDALNTPVILFIRPAHFKVAVPNESGFVVVLDPPREPKLQDVYELAAEWSGESIVVARNDQELQNATLRLGVSGRTE